MSDVLRGHSSTKRVVAVQHRDDKTVRLYVRSHGKISQQDEDFFPFFFLSDGELLKGFLHPHWLKELSGDGYFKHLAVFLRWNEMWEAVRHVLKVGSERFHRRYEHYSEAGFLLLRTDPVHQFLLHSGITLFKGMEFEELPRLQLSFLAASTLHRPPDPRKTEDRILVIALGDNNGWEEVLDARSENEPTMLKKLLDVIIEKDPDVIEGNSLFDFYLPYLLKRCELHGIDMAIGRDGSSLRTISGRGARGQMDIDSTLYEVAGRHLIDTSVLARALETGRPHPDDSLFSDATIPSDEHSDRRLNLPIEKIGSHWEKHPRQVIDVARQYIRDTQLASERLSPAFFSLTTFCPLSFGSVVRSGPNQKIESLLLREYIRQKHSVPRPIQGAQSEASFAKIYITGLAKAVVRIELDALLSNILINENIGPRSDQLGVFLPLLRELDSVQTAMREQMVRATDRHDVQRNLWSDILGSLCNSFYYYMSSARGLFNDFGQADRVALEARKLGEQIRLQLELFNGTIIQADTNAVYFMAPDNVKDADAEAALVDRVARSLPQSTHVRFAGQYKSMFSYRNNNCAFLTYDDKVVLKGNALFSRQPERFTRHFLSLAIRRLLAEDVRGLHELYVNLTKDIQHHRWSVWDFCRTETVRESLEAYVRGVKAGTRKPAPVYELLRRSGLWVKPGSRIRYYVTGTAAGLKISENSRLAEEWDPNFPDENTAYYLSRLEDCTKKFEAAFEPDDFRKVFSPEGLFGFNEGDSKIIWKAVTAEEVGSIPEEDETPEFTIWLADDAE